jgi:hypothetical protein
MEFSILTAGTNTERKLRQILLVKLPPDIFTVKDFGETFAILRITRCQKSIL